MVIVYESSARAGSNQKSTTTISKLAILSTRDSWKHFRTIRSIGSILSKFVQSGTPGGRLASKNWSRPLREHTLQPVINFEEVQQAQIDWRAHGHCSLEAPAHYGTSNFDGYIHSFKANANF